MGGGLARFGALWRVPHVPVLCLTSLLARLPYSVDALAVLLYVRELTGSFATAGLLSATVALSAAVTLPALGRAVDRYGQSRVLVLTAIAHVSGILGLVALGDAGAPVGALVPLAALAGIYPPVSPCLRVIWPGLLGSDEAVRTALALDAILLEIVFVGGPLLAAAIFAFASPAAALVAVGIASTAGALLFAATSPSRGWRGEPREGGALGPLSAPGIRTLLMVALPLGAALGALDVALPAFGIAQGSSSVGAVAIAMVAFGSAIGGIAYGALVPSDVRRAYLGFAAVLPVTIALLLVAGSTLSLLLLAPLAGAVIAPLTAAENELIAGAATPGTVTEAYSWVLTATAGGIALGAAGGGVLAEAGSWRSVLVAAASAGAVGAVVAVSRRRTLTPEPAPA